MRGHNNFKETLSKSWGEEEQNPLDLRLRTEKASMDGDWADMRRFVGRLKARRAQLGLTQVNCSLMGTVKLLLVTILLNIIVGPIV